MRKVFQVIEEELENYERYNQDVMIYICENGIEVANTWVEDFKKEFPQYMDRDIKEMECYSEATYIHII